MTLGLEHLDHALLLIRRELREDVALLACFCELLIAHGIDLNTRKCHLGIDAEPAADVDGNAFAVTRKNYSTDAVLLERCDSSSCRFLRRIQESDEADQYHVALIFDTENINAVNVIFLGNRDDTDAFQVILFCDLLRIGLEFIGDVFYLAVDLDERADGEDFFYRTLGYELALAVLILEHDAHAAAREVERDLIFSCVCLLKI